MATLLSKQATSDNNDYVTCKATSRACDKVRRQSPENPSLLWLATELAEGKRPGPLTCLERLTRAI